MAPEAKSEPSSGGEEPETSSGGKRSKQTSKADGTRRRTKTGCLTCRQRRVKCDELKPTCRNCEKSRRLCAGYQPSAVRSRLPSYPPDRASCPQQSGPASARNMQHKMQRAIHIPQSANAPRETQHSQVTTSHGSQCFRPGYEWPQHIDTVYVGGTGQWPPGHDLHRQTPYDVGSSFTSGPALHSTYRGIQPQKPPHVGAPFAADDSMSGSASSNFLRQEYSTTNTEPRKSSYGTEEAKLATAASSQPSLLSTRSSTISEVPPSHQADPVYHHHLSADQEEDPEDPWDVDTDDEVCNQEALIRFDVPSTPILDERMAYLMFHYRNYLRPCISLFERRLAYDGTSTLAEVLPNLALSCRGLLHGLMAVSALHLAILNRTSEIVPLKHFFIASRKLTGLLARSSSRHKLETLGLTLMLAFYSVILGDHAKWVMHLAGCASFLLEHDFAGMNRAIQSVRARAKVNLGQPWIRHDSTSCQDYLRIADVPSIVLSDEDWEINEVLVRALTGLDIDYANQTQPCAKSATIHESLGQKEIEEWRTRKDLLWWYLKMDIFHSTLSGDPLLLPYDNWKYFAPRGKMGSVSSVYATMDHLWLVLGRLAEFGAKDRIRKQRKISASGGQWQPEPGFLGPLQQPPKAGAGAANLPSANEGRARMPKATDATSSVKKRPPLFFGMMPPPTIPPSMLSSFHLSDAELRKNTVIKESRPNTSQGSDPTLETKHALTEHAALTQALEIWKDALGDGFNALPPHLNDMSAPFTPVLRYSDPMIGCLWAFYHFGKILLRQYHPYSPPAMMVSAAVNAPFTKDDAQAIGRINTGLLQCQVELANAGSINPTLVAALQELTFPLMFAGVQFQEESQRSWTVDNLLDVAIDSGWKSAFSIANALETAWAAQGNYQRTMNHRMPLEARKYDKELSTSDDVGLTPEDEHERRFVKHDRRLLDRFSDVRAFWAVGVLSGSTEELQRTFKQMNLSRNS